ncbi:MAG: CrcB family protein [Cyanobacteria bacterium RUI128]|nr:CrcB family protein [Cyanobacteria bacterium RUI128]
MDLLVIYLGGALGALFRFLILNCFKGRCLDVIGIFFINIIGCFLIGFVSYLAIKKYRLISDRMKKFLSVGFAGGFTTFSAFTHPSLELFLQHHYCYAFLNMFVSVIVGLIFVSWGMNCGYYLMNFLIRYKHIKYSDGQRGVNA